MTFHWSMHLKSANLSAMHLEQQSYIIHKHKNMLTKVYKEI